MSKSFCSLGLMSGTSMDGVDASIILSDGENKLEIVKKLFNEENSLKELQKGNELWLVKLPSDVRPERFEGHDILLDDNAKSILELNNGSVHDALVTKEKLSLPLVCPQRLTNFCLPDLAGILDLQVLRFFN